MSGREWFSGGTSRFVRDAMLLWIGLDLLSMGIRFMASLAYSNSIAGIGLSLVVYAVAYLFRRRESA